MRRLAAQAAAVIWAARAQEAGVAPFTPHDMRRTLISGLLDAGADITTVQRLAGHEDPATTSRYDRRGEAAKQPVVQLVHVPHGNVQSRSRASNPADGRSESYYGTFIEAHMAEPISRSRLT